MLHAFRCNAPGPTSPRPCHPGQVPEPLRGAPWPLAASAAFVRPALLDLAPVNVTLDFQSELGTPAQVIAELKLDPGRFANVVSGAEGLGQGLGAGRAIARQTAGKRAGRPRGRERRASMVALGSAPHTGRRCARAAAANVPCPLPSRPSPQNVTPTNPGIQSQWEQAATQQQMCQNVSRRANPWITTRRRARRIELR